MHKSNPAGGEENSRTDDISSSIIMLSAEVDLSSLQL